MFDVLPRCFDGGTVYDPLVLLSYILFNWGWDKTPPASPLPPHVCVNSVMAKPPPSLQSAAWVQRDPSWYYTGDELYDALVCLGCSCAFVFLACFALRFAWRRLDPQFRAISPAHKQMYCVANVMKAFMLGVMALSRRYWIGTMEIIRYGAYLPVPTKRLSMIYVSTDIVALLLVAKLPISTKIHHYVTAVLVLAICAFDLTTPGYGGAIGVAKMACLYGQFSTLAFLVNGFLAMRVVYPNAKITRITAGVALSTYVACCAGNWAVHAVWLWQCWRDGLLTLASWLYAFGLLFIAQDDIVLMKWLWTYRTRQPREETKKKA